MRTKQCICLPFSATTKFIIYPQCIDVVARTRNSDWRSDHHLYFFLESLSLHDQIFIVLFLFRPATSSFLGLYVVIPSVAEPLVALPLLHCVFGDRVDKVYRIWWSLELSYFRVIVIIRFRLTRNGLISV
ncbi:hypothetical protein M9H77_36794 [Catharanthus roseus]|uniref:Uncharacterized protein n=1 Tax=Catharanthus roseus TaxID=4058 RepID=A0ACB9ZUP0_CATRO|nr:hypothetical protein M9H77_36794 [Catharanthus roseus]